MKALPLVSCIMPTYGRPDYVNESVAMFLAQDYPHKELIILNDCPGQHFTGEFPNVRIVNQQSRYASLGEKRNSCIGMACGSVIAVWDDDDVYLPWRLSYSVGEMDRLGARFYRPAEFWAYWGSEILHDNRSIPGWINHPWVTFEKTLWKAVGGYPALDIHEDDGFYERIHSKLGETFIKYQLDRTDRFGIMRGTSQYEHTSIDGGQHPLDTKPRRHAITPIAIRDPFLRAAHDRLIALRLRRTAAPGASGGVSPPDA
ncbi:MAG TPA: glycosyltransferase family A protein [Trinickia sp.]